MKIKKILSHKVIMAGSWYTITDLFLKGALFLTIPIVTRLLTPTDYGLVSLFTTWLSIFTILISLNLNTSITRAKYEFTDSFNQFVSSITFLSLLVFLLYLIIFSVFIDFFTSITGFSKILFYFMVILAYFNFIKLSLVTKFRVEYKYKLISLISMVIVLSGILLSVFLIVFVFESNNFIGKILGDGIFTILFGIFFLIYLLSKGKELINLSYWKYALLLSLPLILHSISGIVNGQFDRLIIHYYLGEAPVGIYSFAYNIGLIISVVVHSTDQAWAPWVYEKMEEKKYTDIKKSAANYRDVFTFIYAGIILLSPEIVRFMADESYWEGLYLVPWIFMSYYFMFMYTMEVKVEFYYKKTGLISIGTFLSAVINIILTIIFVPIYGYPVAAITTAISFFLLFIFHYLLTSRVIKHKLFGFRFHMVSLTYVLLITLIFFVVQDTFWIRVMCLFVLIIIALIKIKNYKMLG